MQCGLLTFSFRDICLYNFPIVLIGFMNYSLANWVLISILSLPFRPASGTWPSLIRLNYMKTFCVLLTVQVSLRCDRQIIFDSGDMMPYKIPEVSHFHFQILWPPVHKPNHLEQFLSSHDSTRKTKVWLKSKDMITWKLLRAYFFNFYDLLTSSSQT